MYSVGPDTLLWISKPMLLTISCRSRKKPVLLPYSLGDLCSRWPLGVLGVEGDGGLVAAVQLKLGFM